jgi:hypothetical protein
VSEYWHLKHFLTDISSLNDDGSTTPREATLRKILGFQDRYMCQYTSNFRYCFDNANAPEYMFFFSSGRNMICLSWMIYRLEKNMNKLVNLRSKALPSYKELRIPTDWMLDSGMALKATVLLLLYAVEPSVTAGYWCAVLTYQQFKFADEIGISESGEEVYEGTAQGVGQQGYGSE